MIIAPHLDNVPASDAQQVYINGNVDIRSLPQISINECERELSYKRRFKNITQSDLKKFDQYSLHFEIHQDEQCVGGFRLTPIGFNNSEVEHVFSGFEFKPDTLELGRLWVKNQGIGNGRLCASTIFEWLNLKKISFYLKQSTLLGEVAKSLGAKSEGVLTWHKNLNYQCELFSHGV